MSDPARILLLEDNPADAELVLRELRRAGLDCTCQRAASEAEFLAALVPAPDLILADYALPGYSGLAALDAVRERGIDAPVILLSGVIGDEQAVDAMRRGAADYLLKDRLARLGPAVVNALAQRAEQRRAEAARRASEERFRLVSELTSDFAVALRLRPDGHRDIEWATQALPRLTGYSLEELLARGWRGLVHPDDREHVERLVGSVAAGEPASGEVRIHHRSGQVRWLQVFTQPAPPAPDGQPRAYLAAQDITDRKLGEEAQRRRASEFVALYESAHDLAQVHDLPALLPTLVGRALALLQAPVAGVYLFDPARGDLELVYTTGYPVPPGTRLALGEGVAGRVAQSRQTVNVDNYAEWPHRASKLQPIPFAAVVGVPMLYQGELVGVLVVDELRPSTRRFSERDERLLALFAGLAAGAVHTARLLAAQRQRLAELEAVNRISTALRAGQDLDQVLPRLLDETLALMNSTDGAITLVENDHLVVRAMRGRFTEIGLRRARVGRGIAEHVLESNLPHVTREFAADPLLRPAVRERVPPGWGGAVLPIRGQEAAVGVLYVGVSLPREITPAELSTLTTIAEMAGNALQRLHSLEQARQRADQFAAVSALGQTLAQTVAPALDPAQVVPRIAAELAATARRLLPDLAAVSVYLAAPGSEELAGAYAERDGLPLANPPLLPFDPARALNEPRIDNDRPAPALPAALTMPLQAQGQVVGLLLAESAAAGRFVPADADLLAGAAHTAAVALVNARLFAETEQRLEYFEALHHIDMAISGSLDLRVTLMVLLDQLLAKLRVDAAAVLLLNPARQTFDHAVSRGFRTRRIETGSLRLGEGAAAMPGPGRYAPRAPTGRLAGPQAAPSRAALMAQEGFQAYHSRTLVAKGQVKGLLEIFHRAPLAVTPEWLRFVDALANQAAIAVDNGTLFDRLQRGNVELIQAYDATIEGWSHLLDRRDGWPAGHAQRLTEQTLDLGRGLGLAPEALSHLRRGALLHDIGLLLLPDAILKKPGPLDEAEWAEVRRHPEYAQELLLPIAFLRPALDVPYAHHERWDGSGYPRQLAGEAIPLPARLFAVVDVYDALTADRPFRAAWPAEQARAHLHEQAGRLFDPRIVSAFLRLTAHP